MKTVGNFQVVCKKGLEITDVEATAMIIRIPTAEWYDVLSTNI
jgi:hypothetical protein